jgi:hypothetical protein
MHHTMTYTDGVECSANSFHLGTSWRWVIGFSHFIPWETSGGIHLRLGGSDCQWRRHSKKKSSCRYWELNPSRPVPGQLICWHVPIITISEEIRMINSLFWSKIRILSPFKREGTQHKSSNYAGTCLEILVSYTMLATCSSSFDYFFLWMISQITIICTIFQPTNTPATFSGTFSVAESAEYTYRHVCTHPLWKCRQGDFY